MIYTCSVIVYSIAFEILTFPPFSQTSHLHKPQTAPSTPRVPPELPLGFYQLPQPNSTRDGTACARHHHQSLAGDTGAASASNCSANEHPLVWQLKVGRGKSVISVAGSSAEHTALLPGRATQARLRQNFEPAGISSQEAAT